MSDARLAELIAKHDINAALHRFMRGADRLDRELVLSAFHPDAQTQFGGYSGPAANFPEWQFPQLKQFEITSHRITNIQIELIEDKANVETYIEALHVYKDAEEYIFGRFIDMFEARDGDWRISNRLVVIDYSTRSERNTPYSEARHYIRPARDKTDPVYTHRWGPEA